MTNILLLPVSRLNIPEFFTSNIRPIEESPLYLMLFMQNDFALFWEQCCPLFVLDYEAKYITIKKNTSMAKMPFKFQIILILRQFGVF